MEETEPTYLMEYMYSIARKQVKRDRGRNLKVHGLCGQAPVQL